MLVITNADLAGAPIHVRDLAIYMSSQCKKVIVVFGEAGAIQSECSKRNIETHIIPTMRSNINLLQDLSSIIALSRIVSSTMPDVIHAHSTKAGMISRCVAKMHRIPIIYTIHGWGFGSGRRILISLFVRSVEFIFRMLTQKYIAVSNYDRDVGIKSLYIPSSKIFAVHNGIADQPIRTKLKLHNSLIMVARDDPQKDYDTLFRAISGLSVNLYCVGKGTDSEKFMSRARSLSGPSYKNIQFLGVRNDIPELLIMAEIFVLSSNFEGLPISIIEAMRNSMPIVASNVGGVNELVTDAVNGFLFDKGNWRQLQECILKYLNNRALIEEHGSNSRTKFLSEFEINKMLSKILTIYESV